MLAIDVVLLVVASVSFFLVAKLLAFHMYIKSKNMSTYDYILQQRDKRNKVNPGSHKDAALLKKARVNPRPDLLEGSEESREGVNVTANITLEVSKEQLEETQRLAGENGKAPRNGSRLLPGTSV